MIKTRHSCNLCERLLDTLSAGHSPSRDNDGQALDTWHVRKCHASQPQLIPPCLRLCRVHSYNQSDERLLYSVTRILSCQNISRSPLQVLPHSWPWGEEEEPSVSEWWMTPSRSSSSSLETWSEDSRDTSSSCRRSWQLSAPRGSRGWITTTTLSTWSAPPPAPPRPSAPWWRSTSLWTTNTSR